MTIKVEVKDEFVHISDNPRGRLVIPKSYLYELIECLMQWPDEDTTIYYYRSYGVDFSRRSCRLIRSPEFTPITILEMKRITTPYFINGLYPLIDSSYLGPKERALIESYVKNNVSNKEKVNLQTP